MTPSQSILKKLRRMTKDELVQQIVALSTAFDKQKIVNQILVDKLNESLAPKVSETTEAV